jgi:two-component system response regulator
MEKKIVLLVEDNPDDVALTLGALKKNNILNEVVATHDGVEGVDFLFGRGSHTGRDTSVMPSVILLDLKLPRMDGFEVLEHIRSDERTRLLPVVVLTPSKEEQDRMNSYKNGSNSYIHEPANFIQFPEAVRQLRFHWLVLNEPPPTASTDRELG